MTDSHKNNSAPDQPESQAEDLQQNAAESAQDNAAPTGAEQERQDPEETGADDDNAMSYAQSQELAEATNIALLLLGGLSEVIQGSALAQSVRLAWPEARILLVTTQEAAGLAQGLGFDEGMALNHSGGAVGLSGLDRMVARLRAAEVRALLVASPSLRSAMLAWRSKIYLRVTWAGRTDVPLGAMLERLAYTHKIEAAQTVQSRADEIQDLLQPLQIPVAARFARFRPSVAAKTWVTDFLSEKKVDKQRLVSIVPASTVQAKNWPVTQWAQLIDALVERKYQAMLVASEHAAGLCRSIQMACQSPSMVHEAVGCNLEQSAELLRRSQLMIGVDTGLAHLGLAAGAKGILLFGPSDAGRYALAGRAKVLRVAVDCRPCKLADDGACPVEGHACMAGIEAQRVARQAIKLLRKP